MKIACLTFHNSSNYGAVLQTYALQETVKALGHDYIILNYSNAEKLKFDSLCKWNKEMSLFNYLYKLLSLPYTWTRKRKFIYFSNQYLNVSLKYKTLLDLINIGGLYDVYICGSDQVWNASMVRNDPAYFLSFVEKKKKISYAASFGSSMFSMQDELFYKENINNIDCISVREQTGVVLVKKYSNREALLVLDPTLLLNRNVWGKLITENKRGRYILTYRLSKNIEMQKFVQRLQCQTGLKVIGISRGIVPMLRENSYEIPSPQEFVTLFAHATYVVTDSFHGTAFSVNFNKIFFSFIKGNRGDSTNSRLADFLECMSLKDRLFTVCPEREINLDRPDFTGCNACMEQWRKDSISFLESSIEL